MGGASVATATGCIQAGMVMLYMKQTNIIYNFFKLYISFLNCFI